MIWTIMQCHIWPVEKINTHYPSPPQANSIWPLAALYVSTCPSSGCTPFTYSPAIFVVDGPFATCCCNLLCESFRSDNCFVSSSFLLCWAYMWLNSSRQSLSRSPVLRGLG